MNLQAIAIPPGEIVWVSGAAARYVRTNRIGTLTCGFADQSRDFVLADEAAKDGFSLDAPSGCWTACGRWRRTGSWSCWPTGPTGTSLSTIRRRTAGCWKPAGGGFAAAGGGSARSWPSPARRSRQSGGSPSAAGEPVGDGCAATNAYLQLAPVDRGRPGQLAAAGCLGDAAVHGDVVQEQPTIRS
jgi:hypothetical protein